MGMSHEQWQRIVSRAPQNQRVSWFDIVPAANPDCNNKKERKAYLAWLTEHQNKQEIQARLLGDNPIKKYLERIDHVKANTDV